MARQSRSAIGRNVALTAHCRLAVDRAVSALSSVGRINFGALSILDNFLSDVVDSISRRDLSLEHARDRLGHAFQRTEDVRQQLEFEAGQCWWHDSLDQMRSWRGKSAFKRADEFFRFGGSYRTHAHTFGDLGE